MGRAAVDGAGSGGRVSAGISDSCGRSIGRKGSGTEDGRSIGCAPPAEGYSGDFGSLTKLCGVLGSGYSWNGSVGTDKEIKRIKF